MDSENSKNSGDMINMLWKNHKGKVIGVLAGIVFGICVINFGFWRSLFLFVCVAVGLIIGSLLDGDSNIKKIFSKDEEQE